MKHTRQMSACAPSSLDMVVGERDGNVASSQLHTARITMNDGDEPYSARAPLSITTRALSALGYPQRAEHDTRCRTPLTEVLREVD